MNTVRILSLHLLSFVLITQSASSQETDPAVAEKIKQVLAKNYGTTPAADRKFLYNAVDLNDDGKNEYLVALVGSTFCGNAGCTMLVLNNKYGINTRMSIVQFPVYVGPPASKEVTKGYSNIYVSTKGVGYVKMAWNGSKYPTNPSTSPKISDKMIEGKYAFLNEGSQEQYNF
jgi:putative lipoprotein